MSDVEALIEQLDELLRESDKPPDLACNPVDALLSISNSLGRIADAIYALRETMTAVER
jgi:hypothetical protein